MDDVTQSIFAKIARGEVTVNAVYEDDFVIAFPDIAPQAPVHILVIPKRATRNLLTLSEEDRETVGALMLACAEVARRVGLESSGFRVVLNAGDHGGQTVPYLHAHVLGGRPLAWPPG